MVNVVCSRGAWVRWKSVARSCPALLVRGRLERSEGPINLVAERIEPLDSGPVPALAGLPLSRRTGPDAGAAQQAHPVRTVGTRPAGGRQPGRPLSDPGGPTG